MADVLAVVPADQESDQRAFCVASFCDIKTVKTRGMMQLIFECPIEKADEVLAALGGVPQFGAERMMVLAPLGDDYQNTAPPLHDDAKLAIQRAVMLTKDQRFWKFLPFGYDKNEAGATEYLRDSCGIKSRSEIATKQTAYDQFRRLEESFKEEAGIVPTQR